MSAGVIRSHKLVIQFNLDVFRYLFYNKGTPIAHVNGKSYDLVDFNVIFFPADWYVAYDKHGDGCCIDFPVIMTPKIKYGPTCYRKNSDGIVIVKPRLFTEIVCVTVHKKRC